MGDSSVQMRKLIIVTALLLVAHIALLFTRRSAKAEANGTSPVRIGIVLDVGGLGGAGGEVDHGHASGG